MSCLKVLFIFVFLVSGKLFATGQVPDYLIVEKDTLAIQSNPLEEYFKDHPIPDNLITGFSSANWRGYVAYFKFLDGKLVVENIYKEEYKTNKDGKTEESLISIYKDLFGDKTNFQCHFYSGLLICPSGSMIEYIHMGYSSLYENYNLIEVNKGINVKSKKFTGEEFRKFKKDYFKYYKKSNEYKIKVKEFKEMRSQSSSFNGRFPIENPGIGRENKSLKQKESEFNADKEIDSFMFIFLNDYIKTIEIPTN
ncbi:hypothetical protein [Flavobacterium sp. FlaQc-50]|jgi:hypothetical protein|uniref:hypothetical protein n=1 Tax=unclassified Flavobacterium TaxID=196869 RepID=UPI0037579296